jgi:hypothetical protein
MEPLKTVPKAGFETAIPLGRRPAHVSVTALDARKRPLATSRTI